MLKPTTSTKTLKLKYNQPCQNNTSKKAKKTDLEFFYLGFHLLAEDNKVTY